LEREFEPTFDILVEIIDRNEVGVHFDVSTSVDKKLRGIPTTTEIRKISDGELVKVSDEINNIDFSNNKNLLENNQNIRVEEKQEKNNNQKINVFPYGLQKIKLKKLSKSFFSNIRIVSKPESAKIILTTKSNYSKEPKPKIIEMAEKVGIPIHLIKKGSSDQITRFLEKISQENPSKEKSIDNKLDTDNSEALNEVKIGIKKIKNGVNQIELSPQNPQIRRKQHFFATNEGVGSISIGEENNRRIVLKKRK